MTISSAKPLRLSERQQGSVLIIVLWVAFGLVSMALYFANSMSFELRAADNRLASLESEQAIEGGIRYVTNLLANLQEPGRLPDISTYRSEAVEVGDAMFWILGPDYKSTAVNPTYVSFGLGDEGGKLNLNSATRGMLETLPNMTTELAAAIIDWRDTNSDMSENGAEDDAYSRKTPSYKVKNGNFETVDELRLVSGADLVLLYGEDLNQNGILDPNENDGEISPPSDNRDGRLEAGLLNYLTVYSKTPTTRTNGNPRININTERGGLRTFLEEKFGSNKAQQVMQALTGAANLNSILDFYVRSGLTLEEFEQIDGDITTAQGGSDQGLVNINTAPEAVLACLPGIGTEKANAVVAYRQQNTGKLNSVAWLIEAISSEDRNAVLQAGPYITTRTYQYHVDIAAVGRFGRGYRRVKFIVDTSTGTPEIRFRQDLSDLGWALGQNVRQQLAALANKR